VLFPEDRAAVETDGGWSLRSASEASQMAGKPALDPCREPDSLRGHFTGSGAGNRRALTVVPARVYTVQIICTLALVRVMDVNVTALRQSLPAYLKRVRRGERIRITSRGEVIAELAPPAATARESALARKRLRGSVVRYDRPLEPALAPGEWVANQ